MDNLASLSATNLITALKERQISSVELLDFYFERYTRLNPQVNAIVTTDFDNARKKAISSDTARAKGEDWGPLHGLPMTIKDNIEVVGMPTTYGNPLFKDFMPSKNTDIITSLLEAGAIIFGKTNLPLMGDDIQTFNELYGQTNNPWDLNCTPGGSSGGAAAALAAGITGLDIGNDIGGSIRMPAHFCGIYGHKPSYNIISMQGGSKPWGLLFPDYVDTDYSPALDLAVHGPLARSARDLKLAMDVLVGAPPHERKAITIKLPPPRKVKLKEFRVGLWLDDPSFSPDTSVSKCLQDIVNRLEIAGVNLDTKKPDIDLRDNYELRESLVGMTISLSLSKEALDWAVSVRGQIKNYDKSIQGIYAKAFTAKHREWLSLNQIRSRIRQSWSDYFQKYDVLLCPVVRIAAYGHDHSEMLGRVVRFDGDDLSAWEAVIPWNTLSLVSYLPATIAPIGFTSEGLPVGVQIIGPYLEDHTPIQFAMLLEEQVTGAFNVPSGYE